MKPSDLKEGKLYVLDMSQRRDGDSRAWDAVAYDRWHGSTCIFLGFMIEPASPPGELRDPLRDRGYQAGFHQFLWGDKIISLTNESIKINLVTPEEFKKRRHTTGS